MVMIAKRAKQPTLSDTGEHILAQYERQLRVEEDLTPATVRNYFSDLRHFAAWCESIWKQGREEDIAFTPERVSTPTITDYRSYLQQVLHLKPNSVNRSLISLKRYFAWLLSTGQLPGSEEEEPGREDQKGGEEMFEQPNLDEVAEAYLSVRPSEQSEYARLLIQARSGAITPLLRQLIVVIERDKMHSGMEIAKLLYAQVVLKSIIKRACDLVQRIGAPAIRPLHDALFSSEDKLSLIAAMVLAMNEFPNEAVKSEVQHLIHRGTTQRLGAVQNNENIWIVLMLIYLALFRAGNREWKEGIEYLAQQSSLSPEEWIKRAENTALTEIQK